MRRPRRSAFRKSGGVDPSSSAIRTAASSTVRQSGPTVSKLVQSGTVPSSDKRPEVVLSPTRSFHAAGMRTEPPVSLPIPAAASPNATEVAAPDDDPPGTQAGSCRLGGVSVDGLIPMPEKASSDICVLPRQTRPKAEAVASTRASALGVRPFNKAEPASVAVPAVSKRSFQEIGTPSSGDFRVPARARADAALASARARSWVTRA